MSEEQGSEEIHPIQKFYDNIWLLLGIGIVLPTVLFTVWGLIEVFSMPYLPLVK